MELPIEMITHVMKFLAPSDLLSASLVSKKWHAASRDPCLHTAVDVGISISLSKRNLAGTIHVNQSEIRRLCITLVPHSPAGEFKARVHYAVGSCRYCRASERSNETVKKASLFGIPFETLVLPAKLFRDTDPNFPGNPTAVYFDICISLLRETHNLQSLELTEKVLWTLMNHNKSRLSSVLHNITDLNLSHVVFTQRIDVTCFPAIRALTIQKLTINGTPQVEHLRRLCHNSANNLKIRINVLKTSKYIPPEQLAGLLRGANITICRLSLPGQNLTEGQIPLLENICHSVQDLSLLRQPDTDMLALIARKCRLSTRPNLTFPFETFDVTVVSSILSNVRSLVFTGSHCELQLGRREDGRDFSSGINLTLTVETGLFEPIKETVSTLLQRKPLLGDCIGMHVFVNDGSNEIIHEALSTCDRLDYLTVLMRSSEEFRFPESPKVSELRSLRIRYYRLCYNLDVDAVLRLPMPHLQILNVSGTNLSDGGLRSLATYAVDLRSLDVTNCSRITDGGMLTVLTSSERLERLSLGGCDSLTHKCVDYIVQSGAPLSYLYVHSADKYCGRAKELLIGVLSVGSNQLMSDGSTSIV